MRLHRWLLSAWVCALACNPALAQRSPIASRHPIPADLTPRVGLDQCGHFRGHFGPIDYRSADLRDRTVVEEFHFEMELRTFLAGQLSGRNMAGTGGVAFGFVYTLKSFPNHPAALLVLDQLGRKLKSENPQGIEIPLECWYMRAFIIAPDDPAVRALYGIYLANRGREPEALENLKIGTAGTRNSPSLQHQIGLTYLQLKQYEQAQFCALRLARKGFAIDALARQLREAGKWDPALTLPADELAEYEAALREPEAAASAASSAASSAKP